MRQLAGTRTRYRRAHATPLAELISGRAEYISDFPTGSLKSGLSPDEIERITMPNKEPVLLTIVIETARLKWLAAGIGLDQQVFPLLASQDDDLAGYRGLTFDEQASFLWRAAAGMRPIVGNSEESLPVRISD